MLVLSRKAGESIYIDDVKVTVVRLDRNRVKIGIEAPRDKRIIREELLQIQVDGPIDDPSPTCSVETGMVNTGC